MSSFQLREFPAIRHCERSEAIQRWIRELWIASSRSLSSGAHSRDPLAPRNDGKYDAAGSGFCLFDRLFGRLGLCRVSHRPGVAVRGVIGGNLQPLGGGGSLQHDVVRNLSIFFLGVLVVSLSFALAARLTYRSRRRLTAVMRPLFCCFASCRITISRSASAIFCFLRCHRNIPHGQVCSCRRGFAIMRPADALPGE